MSHHDEGAKQVEVREKQRAAAPAEETRPGAVFTPDVDIYETQAEIVLVADMPGVAAEDLVIDLSENVLTVTGDARPQEGKSERAVLLEYAVGRYARKFTVGRDVDRDKIAATLENGVLTLVLPKAERAKPRKITVKQAGQAA